MINEVEGKKRPRFKIFKKYFLAKIIIVMVVLVNAFVGVVGLKESISMDRKATKIGFEDLGELVTQMAYCTELNTIDKSIDFFGITLPFIQSKYIYSYDVVVKAGFDFRHIKWEQEGNIIKVNLPKAKVLSSEIDLNSFKVYYESKNIFTEITLEENNEALKILKNKAEKDAISKGLLDNARLNAEALLRSFFGNVYDLEKYDIVFEN